MIKIMLSSSELIKEKIRPAGKRNRKRGSDFISNKMSRYAEKKYGNNFSGRTKAV